jgi:hypothetical protein
LNEKHRSGEYHEKTGGKQQTPSPPPLSPRIMENKTLLIH